MLHRGSIVVLDFGGQYAHLIANRIRRLGAFSEIREAETKASELKNAAGVILSGGPASVYEEGSPQGDPEIFKLGIPILGICYGHQWIAHALGGSVKPGTTKEYGQTEVTLSSSGPEGRREASRLAEFIPSSVEGLARGKQKSSLFEGLPQKFTVWMSHGDTVVKLPEGFRTIASSPDCEVAAMEDVKRKIFGTQFHLEVTHTPQGMEILKRFVDLCDHAPWSVEDFATHIGAQVKRDVGNRKVFMLVSGGVDSTVAFTLLEKTLGRDRVYGLLVDTGLMRKNEVQQIQQSLEELGFDNLHVEPASDRFFERLKDVYDPEDKRRIIGETFLEVQREVAKSLSLDGPDWVLGQGTIYPDTIETGGTRHADRIKTHHNRVAEIQKMIAEGRVIEPLKDLYKDEVRKLGELLGLPHDLVWRHPFPGPGLGVRILCAKEPAPVTLSLTALPKLGSEGGSKGECRFAHAVLPLRSVGVQGDARTYRHALVLFTDTPIHGYTDTHWNELWQLATDIPNKHRNFNRVLVCTSHTAQVFFERSREAEFIFTPSAITRDRADLLREADATVDEEVRRAELYEKIWQFPVVLLPVGMKPKGQSIVLRPVDSTEAMTANATRLPKEFLETVTKKLLKLTGIDLIFYDLTSKPPATIEWE